MEARLELVAALACAADAVVKVADVGRDVARGGDGGEGQEQRGAERSHCCKELVDWIWISIWEGMNTEQGE